MRPTWPGHCAAKPGRASWPGNLRRSGARPQRAYARSHPRLCAFPPRPVHHPGGESAEYGQSQRDHRKERRQRATELVALYITQSPADEPKPLAVEATVEAPLIDPITGEDLGVPLLGIMDLVLPQADGPTEPLLEL